MIEPNYCWIGLINAGCLLKTRMNDWKWINRDDSSYTNWDMTQPDLLYECCTEMWKTEGKWNNEQCDMKLSCFICGQENRISQYSTSTTKSSSTLTLKTNSISTTLPYSSTNTPSSTRSTRAADNFISTSAGIAIIILASIFFLTTVCLVVVLIVVKRRHSLTVRSISQQLVANIVAHVGSSDTQGHNGVIEARYEDVLNAKDRR